jgi:hypothetical protein
MPKGPKNASWDYWLGMCMENLKINKYINAHAQSIG